MKLHNRCGNCDHCSHVYTQQMRVLDAVSAASVKGVAVDDSVITVWNETLRAFPCEWKMEPTEQMRVDTIMWLGEMVSWCLDSLVQSPTDGCVKSDLNSVYDHIRNLTSHHHSEENEAIGYTFGWKDIVDAVASYDSEFRETTVERFEEYCNNLDNEQARWLWHYVDAKTKPPERQ